MKNKLILGLSIVFLLISVIIFAKSVTALTGSSTNYELRFSLSNSITNISSGTFQNLRISANSLASNLTGNIKSGRLSILKDNFKPLKPELNLPLNDSATNLSSVEFSWSNTTDPNQAIDYDKITYIVEIFNDSDFTQEFKVNTSVKETANTTKSNFTFSEGQQTFYWRVIATDGTLNSTPSDFRTTIVDTIPPSNFTLISPTGSTTDNTPTLTWNAPTEPHIKNYTIEFTGTSNNYVFTSTTNSFSDYPEELGAETYTWQVTAYDKAGNQNSSNTAIVTISAIKNVEIQTTVSGGTSSGSGGSKRKPFNLDIIAPPSVTIYRDDSVIIPLIIVNPANSVTLSEISLELTPDSEDIQVSLNKNFIEKLEKKQQETIHLTILTNDEIESELGTYGVTVTAKVKNPEFSDSVKIFANLIESDDQSKTTSEKQLIFAKEFFDGNPGCIELTEYLAQAETEFNNQRFNKAFSLADNAIQSCKDLIALKSEPRKNTVESYIEKTKNLDTVVIIALESLGFILVLTILYKTIRKKR